MADNRSFLESVNTGAGAPSRPAPAPRAPAAPVDPLAGTGITRASGALNPLEDAGLQAYLRRVGGSGNGESIQRQLEAVRRAQGRFVDDTARDRARLELASKTGLERGLSSLDTSFEDSGLYSSGRRGTERDKAVYDSELAMRQRNEDFDLGLARNTEDVDLQIEAIERTRSSGGGNRQAAIDQYTRDRIASDALNGIAPNYGNTPTRTGVPNWAAGYQQVNTRRTPVRTTPTLTRGNARK